MFEIALDVFLQLSLYHYLLSSSWTAWWSCNQFHTLHIVFDILMISHVVARLLSHPHPTRPCVSWHPKLKNGAKCRFWIHSQGGAEWRSKILWWLAVLINPSHVFHHLGRSRGDARMCFTRPWETGSGSSLSSWQSWCGDGSSQAADLHTLHHHFKRREVCKTVWEQVWGLA